MGVDRVLCKYPGQKRQRQLLRKLNKRVLMLTLKGPDEDNDDDDDDEDDVDDEDGIQG